MTDRFITLLVNLTANPAGFINDSDYKTTIENELMKNTEDVGFDF